MIFDSDKNFFHHDDDDDDVYEEIISLDGCVGVYHYGPPCDGE
jgi:hypothetical protein